LRLHRHYREAAHPHECQVGEGRVRLHRRQRHRLRQWVARFEVHHHELGVVRLRIGVGGPNDPGKADRGLFVAGVVDEHLVAHRHLAEVLEGEWIADAVPDSPAVLQEALEGVGRGLRFENPVGGHPPSYFCTAMVFASTESPLAYTVTRYDPTGQLPLGGAACSSVSSLAFGWIVVEAESWTFPVGNVHFAVSVALSGVPSVAMERNTVSVGANRNVGSLIRFWGPRLRPIMTFETRSFPGSGGGVAAVVGVVSRRALSLSIAPVST